MKRTRKHVLFAAALANVFAFTSAHGQQAGVTRPEAVSEFAPGFLQGYLPKEALPNSLALLPPPPAAGSPAFALDREVSRKNNALRGKRRWTLATTDADLSFPAAAGTFSCALNAPITDEFTPHLYQLMRRTLTDVGLSTYAAKNKYQRKRPFITNKAPICTPAEREAIAKEGSYPSGHAAVGWGWALILTEIAPDRTDALLARGVAYGESRNVCNVHWYSDVVEGRLMAAGTVARLHAEPAFRADLDAARAELAAVRAQGAAPSRDCAVETAASAR